MTSAIIQATLYTLIFSVHKFKSIKLIKTLNEHYFITTI